MYSKMPRLAFADLWYDRVLGIVSFVIHTFLLHASITRPLGESGKLKLTGDMTELEFALGIFLTTGSVQGQRNTLRLEMTGDAYRALRAFRYVRAQILGPAVLTHRTERVCSWTMHLCRIQKRQQGFPLLSSCTTSSFSRLCNCHIRYMNGARRSMHCGLTSIRQRSVGGC